MDEDENVPSTLKSEPRSTQAALGRSRATEVVDLDEEDDED